MLNRESYARHIDKRRASARERYRQDPTPYKRQAKEWGRRNKDKVRMIMAVQNGKRRARMAGNDFDQIVMREWAWIIARADHKCIYCGSREPLELDHIHPIVLGGAHVLTNIVPACSGCNVYKGDADPKKWMDDCYGPDKYDEVVRFAAENTKVREVSNGKVD